MGTAFSSELARSCESFSGPLVMCSRSNHRAASVGERRRSGKDRRQESNQGVNSLQRHNFEW